MNVYKHVKKSWYDYALDIGYFAAAVFAKLMFFANCYILSCLMLLFEISQEPRKWVKIVYIAALLYIILFL